MWLRGGREALARCGTGVKAHSIACQCRHSAMERTFILSLKTNGALKWTLGFCAGGKEGLRGWHQPRTKIITHQEWETLGVNFLSSLNWYEGNSLMAL